MALSFEWDAKKASTNLIKHGVSFKEASTVFADTLSITITDPLHSIEEERFIIIGYSHKNRLVVVVHTELGDKIRIISARLAARRERDFYENK